MSGDSLAQLAEERHNEIRETLARIEASLGRPRANSTAPARAAPSSREPPEWTKDVIESVLFTAQELDIANDTLGREISDYYAPMGLKDEELIVVGLLSGVYMFMGDLTKRITVPHVVDFVAASSYGKETVSAGNVKIKKDLNLNVEGTHVLIVDEMCDSGRTMACLQALMLQRGAKSVKTCVMVTLIPWMHEP